MVSAAWLHLRLWMVAHRHCQRCARSLLLFSFSWRWMLWRSWGAPPSICFMASSPSFSTRSLPMSNCWTPFSTVAGPRARNHHIVLKPWPSMAWTQYIPIPSSCGRHPSRRFKDLSLHHWEFPLIKPLVPSLGSDHCLHSIIETSRRSNGSELEPARQLMLPANCKPNAHHENIHFTWRARAPTMPATTWWCWPLINRQGLALKYWLTLNQAHSRFQDKI